MNIVKVDKTGLSGREIDEILSATRRFPEIEKVILFGSRAKGAHKPGSDIDLAISGTTISYSIVNELSYILNEESTLPYYFDLINIAEISSSALLSHIEEFGVQLNCSV